MQREPHDTAGAHAEMLNAIRDDRPLDLNAEQWHLANPHGRFEQWQQQAHQCLHDGLHYDPGQLNLKAEVIERIDRDGYVLEHVRFNTTPWNRLDGCFLLPTGVDYPVPGIVLFHAWGGSTLWGRHRVVNTGRDHPVLVELRKKFYAGKWQADEFAKKGYAVIVIDNFHYGQRIPYGLGNVPEHFDPFELSYEEAVDMDRRIRQTILSSVGMLLWTGATWAGLNFGDDSRCIDYLQSRPEVDSERIGCTGLS
ncbi:MAG: hypothetical protein KAX78_13475, partial [Phycisphaerae bacterium]|nr:hypothetical protein [Phycisphaerae bacterium]